VTTYRSAVCGDLGALVALEAEMLGDTAWGEESVVGELAGVGTTRHVIVAVDGDRLVGYAALMHVAQVADVQRVLVHRRRRRHGIAGELLRRLLVEAAGRGCREVLLEVAADNQAALALYADFGFAEISRRLRYYAEDVDAVVMALHLPSSPGRHTDGGTGGRDG
jgi:ribosomal-protein-alanine acetyltransferase